MTKEQFLLIIIDNAAQFNAARETIKNVWSQDLYIEAFKKSIIVIKWFFIGERALWMGVFL